MTTIIVSSQVELLEALETADGGETFLLEAGDYGRLDLTDRPSFDLDFPETVTIRSLDPADPAVISGLDMRGASNVTFADLSFDYAFEEGDALWERPFSAIDGRNVSFVDSTFTGDVAEGMSDIDDGYATGTGLYIRSSEGVVVEGCEFSTFKIGLYVNESRDVLVSDNEVHSMRSDGMNFAEVTGVVVEENHFHDFVGAPDSSDHMDMIQFWTSGTDAPTSDVIVRGNLLDVGEGSTTQSIFMRNEMVDRGSAGEELYYRNVTITDNTIVNEHQHGIAVGETAGLVISNNTVLDAGGRDGNPPRISVASDSTDVVISHNVVSRLGGHEGQPDWSIRMNAFVQNEDPGAPGYYGDVFVSSIMADGDGWDSYVATPGGMIDNLGAGSTVTTRRPDVAEFVVAEDERSAATRTFDAGIADLPPGARVEWDFGDGSTGEGARLSHDYGAGGVYDVTVTVRILGEPPRTQSMELRVDGPGVVSMGEDGTVSAYDAGEEIALSDAFEGGMRIGARDVAMRIDRSHVEEILGTDEFSIDFGITAAETGQSGEIFRLHSSLLATVNGHGELVVNARLSDGSAVRLVTEDVTIDDMAQHDVSIRMHEGTIEVIVDGAVAASGEAPAPLASEGVHDLTFGNPWNQGNFESVIDFLEITRDASDFVNIAPAVESVELAGEPVVNLDVGPLDPGSSLLEIEGELRLGGNGVTERVDRAQVEQMLGQDAFDISFTMHSDEGGTGEVLRLHSSFLATVNARGELCFRVMLEDDTPVYLVARKIEVNDGEAHDISLRMEDGRIDVLIDGELAVSGEAGLPLRSKGDHDLTFGSAFGNEAFDGTVGNFSIVLPDAGPSETSPQEEPLDPALLDVIDVYATEQCRTTALNDFLGTYDKGQAAQGIAQSEALFEIDDQIDPAA